MKEAKRIRDLHAQRRLDEKVAALWKADTSIIACRYGAVADVTNTADLETVKKVTHDDVIAYTGIQRLTGVRWTILPVTCQHKLDSIRDHFAQPATDVYEEPGAAKDLIVFLEQAIPTGALVIAQVVVAQTRSGAALS